MSQSLEPDVVDLLLLISQHEWNDEELGSPTSVIYQILADDIPVPFSLNESGEAVALRFTLKNTNLLTVAARVPVGLVGTALITRGLLEALHPAIAAQVGFGGILSDDLRLGDVAVASQVDCYLTKNKAVTSRGNVDDYAAGTEITFAGEVFRPSHSLAQLAANLKHAYYSTYLEFQADARASLRGGLVC